MKVYKLWWIMVIFVVRLHLKNNHTTIPNVKPGLNPQGLLGGLHEFVWDHKAYNLWADSGSMRPFIVLHQHSMKRTFRLQSVNAALRWSVFNLSWWGLMQDKDTTHPLIRYFLQVLSRLSSISLPLHSPRTNSWYV